MAIAMLLCSCADNADPSTSGNTEPTSSGGAVVPEPTDPVEEDDADLSLYFKDGNSVTADVKESRKISVHTESNYLLISGEGNFTVTVNGNTLSPENGELTIENTAADYVSMDMQIDVDAEMTLTFTLIFNPGTAGNPYAVSATEQTQLTYEGEVYFTAPAGWYTIVGEDSFELVNYSLGENGLVYLAADTYTVGTKAEGESVLTITPAETPVGYSEENPILVTELGTVELTMYSGVKMYFRFEAPRDGLYLFSLGTEGKSSNSRFTVNESGIYYGKYYENGVWSTYENGTVYGQWFNEEGGLTIVVDYSVVGSSEDGTGMVGNDIIQIVVSEPYNFSAVKTDVILNKEPKGILYAAFTAPADGIYGIQLGAEGDADEYVRLTLDWNIGEDEAATYYYLWETAVVKLSEGETIYIAIDSETGVGGTVSLFISEETTMPLPEEGWLTGYYKGSTYMIYLDRDKGQVTFSNASGSSVYGICDITYDGETVTFVQGEGIYATTWTLVYDSETGNMTLSNSSRTYTLSWYEPVAEKDISTLQGVYASDDGDELSIAADGSGVYQNSRYDYDGSKNYYNTSSIDNILHWGAYITIEQGEDGNSVTVGNKDNSGNWTYTVYTRTASAYTMPVSKLSSVEVGVYVGESYTLTISSGSQKFNEREFYILAADDGEYTISGLSASYDWTVFVLKITDSYIVLYNTEGTMVDALEKFDFNAADLPAETTATALPSTDSENIYGYYIYKAAVSGWYCFESTSDLRLYVPQGELYPSTFGTGSVSGNNGTWYELQAGDMIAVASISGKVTYAAENPNGDGGYAWDGTTISGSDLSSMLTKKVEFPVTLTVSADGKYVLKLVDNGSVEMYYNYMAIVIDGVTYGRYYTALAAYNSDYQADVVGITIELGELKAGDTVSFVLYTYNTTYASRYDLVLETASDDSGNGGEVEQESKLEDTYSGDGYTATINNGTISIWLDGELLLDSISFEGPDAYNTYTLASNSASVWNFVYEEGNDYIQLKVGYSYITLNRGTASGDEDDDGEDLDITTVMGTWEAVDNNGADYKVTISESGITIVIYDSTECSDVTDYTISGNKITISYEVWSGYYSYYYLTVTDEGIVLANAYEDLVTLTQGGSGSSSDVQQIPADSAGTYTGTDAYGNTYSLTINADGTVDLVYEGQMFDWDSYSYVTVTNSYTGLAPEAYVAYYEYDYEYPWVLKNLTLGSMESNIAFGFTSDGSVVIMIDDYEEKIILTQGGNSEDSGNSDDSTVCGTYIGTNSNGYVYYQVILGEETVAINFWYNGYEEEVYTYLEASAYSLAEDGKLTLTYDPYGDGYSYTIEITFNEDGTIDVYDSYNDYEGTGEMLATGLAKQDGGSDGIYGTWNGEDSTGTLYKVELTETGISYWEGYELDQQVSNGTYSVDGSNISFTIDYGFMSVDVVLTINEDGTLGLYKYDELYATLTKDGSSTDSGSGSAGEETGLISSTYVGYYWTTDWDLLTVSTTGISLSIGNDELTPTVSATLQTDVYAFTYEGGTYDGEYCYLYLYSFDDGSCSAYLYIGGNDPIIFYT